MKMSVRKVAFRIAAVVLLSFGLPARFDPRGILPSNFSWSGDFATSEYGLRVAAFADVANIVIAAGILLLILSFTTLTDAQGK